MRKSSACRVRVDRVSSASRVRASVNLWVDGTVHGECSVLLGGGGDVWCVMEVLLPHVYHMQCGLVIIQQGEGAGGGRGGKGRFPLRLTEHVYTNGNLTGWVGGWVGGGVGGWGGGWVGGWEALQCYSIY